MRMPLASGDNIEDTETDSNEPLYDESCASAVDHTNLKDGGGTDAGAKDNIRS